MKIRIIFVSFVFLLFICRLSGSESLLEEIKALSLKKVNGEISENEYNQRKSQLIEKRFGGAREDRSEKLLQEREAKRLEEIERLKSEKAERKKEELQKKIKLEIEKNPDKAFELPIIRYAEVHVITHLDLQRYPSNKSKVLQELGSTYHDEVAIHYEEGPFDKGLERYGNYYAVTDKKTGKHGWVYSKYFNYPRLKAREWASD